MGLPYRPLGVVKEIIDQMGAEITYAYEDLVFLSHNHFLLQFGPTGAQLYFWRNREMPVSEARQAFADLQARAIRQGVVLTFEGAYSLDPAEGERLSVAFYAAAEGDPGTVSQ